MKKKRRRWQCGAYRRVRPAPRPHSRLARMWTIGFFFVYTIYIGIYIYKCSVPSVGPTKENGIYFYWCREGGCDFDPDTNTNTRAHTHAREQTVLENGYRHFFIRLRSSETPRLTAKYFWWHIKWNDPKTFHGTQKNLHHVSTNFIFLYKIMKYKSIFTHCNHLCQF